MPQIDAVVSWDDQTHRPVVSKNPIVVPPGNGATVIKWTCDSTVDNLEITGLDTGVFSPPMSTDSGKSSTSTDRNQHPGSYAYHVSARQAATGKMGKHDPRIENGGGEGN